MLPQFVGINKSKVAYVTVVRFPGEVGFLVDIEGGGHGEGSPTLVTDTGPLTSVESNMPHVHMLLPHKLVTIFTFVHFEFDVFQILHFDMLVEHVISGSLDRFESEGAVVTLEWFELLVPLDVST